MKGTAVILGATGLVGNLLLEQILATDAFQHIIILTRKPTTTIHPKLENIVTDFSDVDQILKDRKVDVLFSCLGTTRKQTPDLTQYRFIEVGIPLSIAQQLSKNGLSQIHFISAIGVNEKSNNFYLKIKNEAEKALASIQAPSYYIYRPALIVGKRKENRFSERLFTGIFKVVNVFMLGKWKKYRSIQADQIAQKMLHNALHPLNGEHIIYFP